MEISATFKFLIGSISNWGQHRVVPTYLILVPYRFLMGTENLTKLKPQRDPDYKENGYFSKLLQKSLLNKTSYIVVFCHTDCLTYSFTRRLLIFSVKMVPENVENGIVILALCICKTTKLLRCFGRLIRPKLGWLDQRCC